MRQKQKNIVSLLGVFTMIFMSCFGNLFAATTLANETPITIHLAGDSTVKTYEDNQFIGGWGEFIQNYFDETKVTFRNYSEGGRSTRSFINEGRLIDSGIFTTEMAPKGMGAISEHIKAGDYLFIQFGHNDDNSKGYSTMYDRMIPLGEPDDKGIYPVVAGTKTSTNELPAAYLEELEKAGLDAEAKQAAIDKALKTIQKYGDTYYAYDCGGTYKWFLKQYVDFARANDATPVLVTPVSRRYFDANGKIESKPGHHGGSDAYCDFRYVEAMRQLAAEENVILIDLFEETKALYEVLGDTASTYLQSLKDEKGSRLDGIWINEYNDYIANGGYGSFDNTHQNKFGANVFAGMLVEAMMMQKDVVKGLDKQTESLSTIVGAAYTVPTQFVQVPDKLADQVTNILSTFESVKPIEEVNEAISRGDFCKITVKMLGLSGEAKVNFSDVAANADYASSIALMTKSGYVTGRADATFKPESELTREDAMCIAIRILKKAGKLGEINLSLLDELKDQAAISSYARESVAACMTCNVMDEVEGYMNPKAAITRAQAYTMLQKVYDLLNA